MQPWDPEHLWRDVQSSPCQVAVQLVRWWVSNAWAGWWDGWLQPDAGVCCGDWMLMLLEHMPKYSVHVNRLTMVVGFKAKRYPGTCESVTDKLWG